MLNSIPDGHSCMSRIQAEDGLQGQHRLHERVLQVLQEQKGPKNDNGEDYLYLKKIMEVLRNKFDTRAKYVRKIVFDQFSEFKKYLAKARRSLEPMKSYIARTCHPLLLLLGTLLGM